MGGTRRTTVSLSCRRVGDFFLHTYIVEERLNRLDSVSGQVSSYAMVLSEIDDRLSPVVLGNGHN